MSVSGTWPAAASLPRLAGKRRPAAGGYSTGGTAGAAGTGASYLTVTGSTGAGLTG